MSVSDLTSAQKELLAAFGRGERTALSRVISLVENRRAGFEAFLHALHTRLGAAHRIGITGPPGAGKSTLCAALTQHYRRQAQSVAVVAVDPTSPYTGGAFLGDRVRMNELALDEHVFIRSMASRGSLGGLALATREVADVMDAFGFDRVILETVGVGQSELEVASAADSTVLVLVPESGDSIQAMKAGLMEAADIFVINKADRPGADRITREIQMMLHLRLDQKSPAWEEPVLQTVAEKGTGVEQLAEALDRHRTWLLESGELSRRRRLRLSERVRAAVERRMQETLWRRNGGERVLEQALDDLEAGVETPYGVADRIVRAALGNEP